MSPQRDEPFLLSEQADLWVVAKPAHWLTIPGRPEQPAPQETRSVAAADRPVLSHWVEKNLGPAWVVHRLDVQTSGLLVFARSADSHRALNTVFQNHQAKKIYECLAQGVCARPMLRLNEPIEGKRSLTQVEVVIQYREVFHARVRIETGRQHQIRIHLAGQGHPLLGDHRYGKGSGGGVGVDRVALHAASLTLPDGRSWSCALPKDFQGWLKRLKEAK